jgi:hypothetical protein
MLESHWQALSGSGAAPWEGPLGLSESGALANVADISHAACIVAALPLFCSQSRYGPDNWHTSSLLRQELPLAGLSDASGLSESESESVTRQMRPAGHRLVVRSHRGD